jgi:hypothetical protein
MNSHTLLHFAFVSLCILPVSNAFASCGSSACSINTNWDEHSIGKPGLSLDLRESYSRADQLRSGTAKVTPNPTAPANAGIEVENLRTINKITTLSADYTVDEHWGVTTNIPYVSRDHRHTIGDPDPALLTTESFEAKGLGDIKITGRYRTTLNEAEHSSIGIKFGIKLNTGRKDFQLKDATGAQIGVPSEVTLQPGNGSTDLILGAFWNQTEPGNALSWFAQGTLQSSVKNTASFRPGNQVNLDGGMRYAFGSSLSGLLQLNAQWNATDSGASAATTEAGDSCSGGKIISLTPGLSYAVIPGSNLYALLQLPLYQYVNGEQLTASKSVTVGINHRF